ncbi:DUF397 domain-containing protein [Actinoallomurus spadix]|uniref:DUF397 domain-containing protein n=1 Tax=Actinoallomurus spadix TaxID=79912 RepID=A0ABN0WIH6_9ACTN|nr:DUF397 domain-containing protein [Actinoallomurus spadix]MCO5991233.1 DUF397 domain-containing protein [Actinoallomurus spadix]
MNGTDTVADAADDHQAQRVIAVRDSKDPDGPKLFFSVSAWRDLLTRIKAGELELPEDMRETLDERFR